MAPICLLSSVFLPIINTFLLAFTVSASCYPAGSATSPIPQHKLHPPDEYLPADPPYFPISPSPSAPSPDFPDLPHSPQQVVSISPPPTVSSNVAPPLPSY
eukprot:c48124_g1_i1 orf=244-546(+)